MRAELSAVLPDAPHGQGVLAVLSFQFAPDGMQRVSDAEAVSDPPTAAQVALPPFFLSFALHHLTCTHKLIHDPRTLNKRLLGKGLCVSRCVLECAVVLRALSAKSMLCFADAVAAGNGQDAGLLRPVGTSCADSARGPAVLV